MSDKVIKSWSGEGWSAELRELPGARKYVATLRFKRREDSTLKPPLVPSFLGPFLSEEVITTKEVLWRMEAPSAKAALDMLASEAQSYLTPLQAFLEQARREP